MDEEGSLQKEGGYTRGITC